MRNDVQLITQRVIEKFRRTVPMAATSDLLPYRSDDGKWVESPWNCGNGWWTAGFWPGMMWLLNAISPEKTFEDEAIRATELMTEQFRVFRHLNHGMDPMLWR